MNEIENGTAIFLRDNPKNFQHGELSQPITATNNLKFVELANLKGMIATPVRSFQMGRYIIYTFFFSI